MHRLTSRQSICRKASRVPRETPEQPAIKNLEKGDTVRAQKRISRQSMRRKTAYVPRENREKPVVKNLEKEETIRRHKKSSRQSICRNQSPARFAVEPSVLGRGTHVQH